MEGIDDKYIENAIAALEKTLGVKDHVSARALISLVESHNVGECIREIAKYLGLPIRIDLSYVPRGYRADRTDGFSSTDLVKTAWGSRGGQGITAQVSIPECLPLYGTPGLNNYPIGVRISEDCTDSPATFIAVMAHELSHVVLHSFWHREKDNEVYTDLTAMMLGFSAVMKDGRKVVKTTERPGRTETGTTTYGYLSDGQFAYAYDRIEAILRKYWKQRRDLLEKTAILQGMVDDGKRTMDHFEKYLVYVDRKLDERMPQEDAYRICVCHQEGYANEFERSVREAENKLQRLHAFIQHLDHYNDDVLGTIRRHEDEIQAVARELASTHNGLLADVGILKRHVSLLYRLKVEGRTGLR
jgi:hypothetical protein